ncbi:Flp family type IVb pilin [Pseudarthrobacter raffinosi]|uniref:Flp family type IVb pilin n=1 Tax=Pseudarthrobacter raffinosi TaxID=2953651 RepID=UPI00208F48E4|nr:MULTISPECIES: Flp family type IVb pilin [unclassified Pseudarthrobacter]MCO4236031.1 Flp family type IVb pilin [Pseudarthrobacter sp. MDT3-28]MCO4253312.1 Flp family type IVb pilin [Pseudarthrobacter sp. MDT3-9]
MQGLKSNVNIIVQRLNHGFRSVQSLQKGATAVEYALLVGFIATVIVVSVGFLGKQLIPGFQNVLAGL